MRRRIGRGGLLLLAAVVLMGAGAGAFPLTVASITFEGLDGIRQREVVDVMEIRPGDEILEADLQDASQAIFDMGFFREVYPEVVGEGDLVFHLTEFPRIRTITVTGNESRRPVELLGFKLFDVPVVSTTKIKQLLRAEDIRPGKVINQFALETALKSVIDQYNQMGFLLVAVDPRGVILAEDLVIPVMEASIEGNEIRGLGSVPLAAAEELIDIPIGEPLKQVDVNRVLLALNGSVLFSSVEVLPIAGSGETDIILEWTLTERQLIDAPLEFQSVDLAGVTQFPGELAHSTLGEIPSGSVSNYELLRVVEGLFDLYQDTGYVMVRFVPQGVEDGVLQLRVDEGVVSEIALSGNTRTYDHVILRNLKIEPGDILTRRALQVAQQRLASFGYFGSANLLPEWSGDGVRLSVIVTERNDLGGMNGTLTVEPSTGGIVGELSIDQRNLFGTGQDVSIKYSRGFSSDVEPMTSTWTLAYSTVALFPGFDRVGADVYRSISDAGTDDVEEYVTVGAKLSFDYPIGDFTDLSLGYKHEDERLVGTTDWSPIDSVTVSLVYDNVDDPRFPMNGNHRSISIEQAGGFAAGQEFTKLGILWMQFSPLENPLFGDRDQALAIRIRAGWADDNLSATQAFRLGGSTSVRGTAVSNVNRLFFANFEHRVELVEGLSVATFFDAGVDLANVSVEGALASTGFGFNIDAAGMVFRLEFIWVIDEEMGWLPTFDIGFGRMF